jgi:hypothetical protein
MAICFLSLAAFLVLASVAKLRPNLDEEEFDLPELEKLQKLVSTQRSGDALSIGASDHRRTFLFDAAPPGQSEQASGPKAPAPVPYPQATHDLIPTVMRADRCGPIPALRWMSSVQAGR